jgi:hypothetical protein
MRGDRPLRIAKLTDTGTGAVTGKSLNKPTKEAFRRFTGAPLRWSLPMNQQNPHPVVSCFNGLWGIRDTIRRWPMTSVSAVQRNVRS